MKDNTRQGDTGEHDKTKQDGRKAAIRNDETCQDKSSQGHPRLNNSRKDKTRLKPKSA
jgi:hypothetical protein